MNGRPPIFLVPIPPEQLYEIVWLLACYANLFQREIYSRQRRNKGTLTNKLCWWWGLVALQSSLNHPKPNGLLSKGSQMCQFVGGKLCSSIFIAKLSQSPIWHWTKLVLFSAYSTPLFLPPPGKVNFTTKTLLISTMEGGAGKYSISSGL